MTRRGRYPNTNFPSAPCDPLSRYRRHGTTNGRCIGLRNESLHRDGRLRSQPRHVPGSHRRRGALRRVIPVSSRVCHGVRRCRSHDRLRSVVRRGRQSRYRRAGCVRARRPASPADKAATSMCLMARARRSRAASKSVARLHRQPRPAVRWRPGKGPAHRRRRERSLRTAREVDSHRSAWPRRTTRLQSVPLRYRTRRRGARS